MEVIENESELAGYFERHAEAISTDRPCLMDQFLEGALEVDVDLVRGVDWTVIGGVVALVVADAGPAKGWGVVGGGGEGLGVHGFFS